jgi:hypothetical protein
MSTIRIQIGISNIFGFPLAFGLLEPEDNDGFSAIMCAVGPFSFSIGWRRD